MFNEWNEINESTEKDGGREWAEIVNAGWCCYIHGGVVLPQLSLLCSVYIGKCLEFPKIKVFPPKSSRTKI